MTSGALMAHGTQLKRAGVSIAEVTKISGFSVDTDAIDVTNTDSGGVTEFKPGLRTVKDLTVEGNLRLDDATGQMQLAADQIAGTISNFTIEGPSTLPFSWTFSAFVKSFETDTPVAESQVAKYKIVFAITGSASLSATASANLTGLTISVGTLSPAFTGATKLYTDALTNGTASVTVTATMASAESIKLYVNDVNTQTLSSGSASSAITTPVGTTKIQIVTKDASKVPVWYTIYASRTT